MADRIQIRYLITAFGFLIPLLAMFAPLIIATVLAILAIYPTYIFIRQGRLKNILNTNINKVITILLIYSLISSFWAINPSQALHLWIRIFLLFICSLSLFAYMSAIPIEDKDKILKALLWGVIAAILVANIEIFTGGTLTKYLRLYTDIYFTKNHKIRPPQNDYVVELNRGSSALSILSWVVLCYLFSKQQYKTAILLLLVVLTTIGRLESFSTVLGFFVAGAIVFPVVYFKGKKALNIFAILIAISVFAVSTTAALIDADKLIGKVPVLPGAASNMRIYIYDYAAEQALKKPIFGWGLNASRSYPVKESEYVDGGRNPLPLHPHNNTLQIWLELGAIGLIIFASLLVLVVLRISQLNAHPYVIASFAAFFANYFIIGQTAYGVWQNWWISSGIITASFLLLTLNLENNKHK